MQIDPIYLKKQEVEIQKHKTVPLNFNLESLINHPRCGDCLYPELL